MEREKEVNTEAERGRRDEKILRESLFYIYLKLIYISIYACILII